MAKPAILEPKSIRRGAHVKILLVEDDTAIDGALTTFLTQKGCRVTVCPTLSGARDRLATDLPDVALLDWNLPDGQGADLCRELWQRWPRLPLLMLTVRDDTRDILAGFACGADDYVTKPFDREVLYARLLALGRRSCPDEEAGFCCGGIRLDSARQTVTCQEEAVALAPLEYQLLHLLMQNKGRTVTRPCFWLKRLCCPLPFSRWASFSLWHWPMLWVPAGSFLPT